MPLRTPSLTSCFQHQNPKQLSPREPDFIHRNLKSPTISYNSPKNITRASSYGDLAVISRSVLRNSSNGANCLFENNSGLMFWGNDNLDVNEGCEVQVMIDGGGGVGGGKICGGGGGDYGGGYGGDGTDVYYRNMIEANPNNSLVLGNYAKYLKHVRGDVLKAEEYCSRAILANPSDGVALSMYADLIWETQKDASRAQSYFDQAVKASPDDCYIMATYARFLWDADEEVSDTNLEAPSFIHEGSQQFPIAAPS